MGQSMSVDHVISFFKRHLLQHSDIYLRLILGKSPRLFLGLHALTSSLKLQYVTMRQALGQKSKLLSESKNVRVLICSIFTFPSNVEQVSKYIIPKPCARTWRRSGHMRQSVQTCYHVHPICQGTYQALPKLALRPRPWPRRRPRCLSW